MARPGAPSARTWLVAVLLAIAAIAAAAVRLATWPWVFVGGEVWTAGDGDVHYHLLQAQRLFTEGLGAVWRDVGLNFPLDAFRLVGESQAMASWRAVDHPVFKLFEPVAGARLEVRGAAPGGRVEASTELRTTAGRLVTWRTSATAGADGLARLRLPYAAGFNGAVLASPWRVTAGRLTSEVAPDERAVLLGESRAVTLGP